MWKHIFPFLAFWTCRHVVFPIQPIRTAGKVPLPQPSIPPGPWPLSPNLLDLGGLGRSNMKIRSWPLLMSQSLSFRQLSLSLGSTHLSRDWGDVVSSAVPHLISILIPVSAQGVCIPSVPLHPSPVSLTSYPTAITLVSRIVRVCVLQAILTIIIIRNWRQIPF